MVIRPLKKMPELAVIYKRIEDIKPDPNNARKHGKRQLTALAAAIREYGFTNPVLVDELDVLIAGHARLEAAKALGMTLVPCIIIRALTPAQRTALAIADNKIGDLSTFDPERLCEQLRGLDALNFDIELTGFSTAEFDIMTEAPKIVSTPAALDTFEEPDPETPAVTRLDDLWRLGKHTLACGSALRDNVYVRALGGRMAQVVFTDPPYNVPISGHVSGLGKVKHREFAMGVGEMTSEEFTTFLRTFMELAAKHSADGSLHLICMDWRHLKEALAAGETAYDSLKNLCVWNKSNAGMGSLWRSKHELVLVFKKGDAPHINNVELGKNGRYRTNVWDYAGVNTFRRGRQQELQAHPTCKPISLVADALRDCSKRGGLVLDCFSGSGTTILAAEKTGRHAAAIELEPRYVDVAIRRWEGLTGQQATLADDGRTFAEVAAARSATEADR